MDRLESLWRVAGVRLILAVLGLAALGGSRAAAACPSIDPTKGFVSNFANPCYELPMAVSVSNGATDLEAIYTRVYFQVNPAYELIILGTYPNARFMSASVYDDHLVVVGRGKVIADTSVADLIASASADRVTVRTSARWDAMTALSGAPVEAGH